MRPVAFCTILCGLLAAMACADDEPLGEISPGGSGGGSGASGGLGGSVGIGGSGGDAGGGAAGAAAQQRYAFLVEVEQGVTGRRFRFSRVRASLADFEHDALPELQTVGGCDIIDYQDFEGYPSWTPTPGSITVSTSDDTVTMEPLLGPEGTLVPQLYAYDATVLEIPRWLPGQRVIVGANGDVVHGFQAALGFPEQVVSELPLVRFHKEVLPRLERMEDLRLVWDPIEEQVGVSIVQYRADALDRVAYDIRCAFVGGTGQGRIPSAVLTGLDPDDMLSVELSRTELFVSGQKMMTITKGDYEIRVTLSYGQGYMVNVR